MPKLRFSHQHALEVLQLIRKRGTIARADVVDETGDSSFLISKVCDELLDGQFITEAGLGDSTGGRRPTLLSLRPGFGRLVGVHMGTVNARIVVTDFSSNVIAYSHHLSHAEVGPEVAMGQLIQRIDEMLASLGLAYSDVNGIGFGISGVLERSTGVSLYWPKLSNWLNVPVKKILEDRYKTLVAVEDTPRTRALAEYYLGGANAAKHFIFITLGGGTGAALFLNGTIYQGAGGFAGEFGHITVAEEGPLCSCGNRGCLETMVSASALIGKARQGVVLGLSNPLMRLSNGAADLISVQTLAEAAREGDRFTIRLLAEAGAFLGRGVVSLVNLLNPELVVIGGGIAGAVGEWILPAVQRQVQESAMIQPSRQVEIRLSQLEENAWAIGASLLVVEEALSQAFLKWSETRQTEAEESLP